MNTITDSIQVQPLKLDNGDKAAFKSYSTNSFESFFKKAMELYNETNIYQNEAEQMQRDFVTGKSDDIIALNMAQAKASSSIQFTTNITSKVLAAYQEIMRMSI